jgi:phage terminase large subunit GpA-like protein
MNGALHDPFPYANARRLVAEAFEAAFMPPSRGSVADHAAANRYLSNEGGGYIGLWRHDIAPYLTAPMEMLNTTSHTTVAVIGPGQSGKTSIPENWLLAAVDENPADMLWYMPTAELMQGFVKKRVNGLIEDHDILKKKLGLRPVDDSLGFKRFRNMTVEFLVTTRSSLISKSAGRIVVDEWDASDPSLGDIKPLVDIRRQTFGRESTLLALSHCDLAGGLDERHWTKGIMSLYRDSDRRLWWWQCPQCGCYSSPNPTASRVMTLEYPADAPVDEIAEATQLLCPVNGCLISEAERRGMNLTGRWVGAGQSIGEDGTIEGALIPRDTAGFWIVGIMSPFILGGIGGLAAAKVKAEREAEATGDTKTLREVIVKQIGIPFDPPRKGGSVDATELADRAEPALRLGEVPAGVRFLTAAVDVQGNRFEYLVRGWGRGGESWVIEVGKRPGDPATSPEDWDGIVKQLLEGVWPLADGSGRGMKLRGMVYDSGGQPGVTAQAYDAWRRWRERRLVINHGKVDGRDAWSMMPAKGLGGQNAPPLMVVYPDSVRKDRKAPGRGQVPLARFNANLFKDYLAGQLARASDGPWSVHIPAGLRSLAPPHSWFEQLTAEVRAKNGTWSNDGGAANEATDLMAMSHVAAHLHGLARMNWDRAPAWASEWNNNPLVVALAPVVSHSPATPTTVTSLMPRLRVPTVPPAVAPRSPFWKPKRRF